MAATPSAPRPVLSAGELRRRAAWADRRAIAARACGCSPSRSAPPGGWSSSAPSCPSASTRSTCSRARCSSAARSRCCSRPRRGYALARRRAAAGGGDARPRGDDLGRRPRRPPAAARGARRDPPAGGDPQRDAGPDGARAPARARRSSPTPATSCARRWPSSGASSSSPPPASPDRAELARVVASATEETDRLVALAEELLTLARLDDAGRCPIRPRAARRARGAGRGRVAFASPRAPRRGRTLVVGRPAADRLADAVRLRQALDNLVDERAAPRRRGRADRRARRARRDVEVHVRDEGARLRARLAPARVRPLRARRRRTAARRRGWASRSSPRWRRRTAAARTLRTARRAARTSGSRCPPRTGSPFIAVS